MNNNNNNGGGGGEEFREILKYTSLISILENNLALVQVRGS